MDIPSIGKNDIIYTYKEQWFNGFAPCFDGGLFSLACCKGSKSGRGMRHSIAGNIENGKSVWILSIAGKDICKITKKKYHDTSKKDDRYIDHKPGDILYLAKVENVITWADYVKDYNSRYDCIYRFENGKITCLPDKPHNEKNMPSDCAMNVENCFTELKQIILSEEYYVFDSCDNYKIPECFNINRGYSYREKENISGPTRAEALNELLSKYEGKIIASSGENPFMR